MSPDLLPTEILLAIALLLGIAALRQARQEARRAAEHMAKTEAYQEWCRRRFGETREDER
jgi:protoporphyrinogen oxidase